MDLAMLTTLADLAISTTFHCFSAMLAFLPLQDSLHPTSLPET